MAERSEAKSAKRSFKSKYLYKIFDAKLRFALFASLRSAILATFNLLIGHFPQKGSIQKI